MRARPGHGARKQLRGERRLALPQDDPVPIETAVLRNGGLLLVDDHAVASPVVATDATNEAIPAAAVWKHCATCLATEAENTVTAMREEVPQRYTVGRPSHAGDQTDGDPS
jgi:hypothetical protein